MADDILKAYGQPRKIDALMDVVLLFDPELQFNPYVWASRRFYEKWVIEPSQKPGMKEAVLRYREAMDKLYKAAASEEMLKGQAFGL